ncbi:hypothetical protein [Pusillimonas sp.]|uniref:hypothetical protein n=1 Tax=Pusillimonas sp. TaxID=3040095 RepID=UPI0037C9BE0D
MALARIVLGLRGAVTAAGSDGPCRGIGAVLRQKALRQHSRQPLTCGTDAALGLVGYLRRDDMVPMSRLHRQLACTAHVAASTITVRNRPEKAARSGGQWRARKPQRRAAAGEHRTGEHPA